MHHVMIGLNLTVQRRNGAEFSAEDLVKLIDGLFKGTFPRKFAAAPTGKGKLEVVGSCKPEVEVTVASMVVRYVGQDGACQACKDPKVTTHAEGCEKAPTHRWEGQMLLKPPPGPSVSGLTA